MTNLNKLMKISYYDIKSEVRLEAYADTIVLEKADDSNANYFAAIRFGGYPESVKGMLVKNEAESTENQEFLLPGRSLRLLDSISANADGFEVAGMEHEIVFT